jgi:hypothetical protein
LINQQNSLPKLRNWDNLIKKIEENYKANFFWKKKLNVEQWNWKKRVKKGHWPTFTFQTRDGSLDQKHHTLKNQMLKDKIRKKINYTKGF